MNEIAIALNTQCGIHLYEQIYEYIKQEIRQGRIQAGEKLPSTRMLARHLQVSRSTVDVAYDQLLSEGYIEARPYKGYFVCRVEELFAWKKSKIVEPDRNDEKEQDKIKYDFSPNAIDMSGFPFSTWRKITRDMLIDDRSELFALGKSQGDITLRRTICKYLRNSRGVDCKPSQIVIGAGNDYLLMLLGRVLGNSLKVAMENPTYPRAYKIFSSFGYQITNIPMDNQGICVDQLQGTDISIAYVMPAHQFPMGTVMSIGRRMELLRWASERKDRYIIEDDYDSEYRFRGKPIPALQSLDTEDKVIYIGTFSKAIAPAIRVSYMVLPENLTKRYQTACGFLASTVSRLDQTVLNEFIETGAFEKHLNKMRKLYKTKHDLLLQELKPFEDCFLISGEDAGLHLLMTEKKSERRAAILVDQAYQYGVKVYSLSDYYVPQKDTSTILLGYGGLDEKKIAEGLQQLKIAWL